MDTRRDPGRVPPGSADGAASFHSHRQSRSVTVAAAMHTAADRSPRSGAARATSLATRWATITAAWGAQPS
jgi:hypothetical protein